MTVKAIKSLVEHSRNVNIAVITPPSSNESDDSYKSLFDLTSETKIIFRKGKKHFSRWYPTQVF